MLKSPRTKICFSSLEIFSMIIKLCNIQIKMFINTANNNVILFSVNYFNERGFYLIFFNMLRWKRSLYERQLEIYWSVPSAEDSTGVDSKEQFFKLILQFKEVFLKILVLLTAIISNDLFVHFSRYSRSSKFLFNKHAFIWKKDRYLYLYVILVLILRQYQNI